MRRSKPTKGNQKMAKATLIRFPTLAELNDWGYSDNLRVDIDHLSHTFNRQRVPCDFAPRQDNRASIWIDGICYPASWFRITHLTANEKKFLKS